LDVVRAARVRDVALSRSRSRSRATPRRPDARATVHPSTCARRTRGPG
jgi:hypothetical protein